MNNLQFAIPRLQVAIFMTVLLAPLMFNPQRGDTRKEIIEGWHENESGAT
jgi:hypothetical protein